MLTVDIFPQGKNCKSFFQTGFNFYPQAENCLRNFFVHNRKKNANIEKENGSPFIVRIHNHY